MTCGLASSAAAGASTCPRQHGHWCALAAASASHGHINAGAVVLVLAALAVVWLVRAWLWPFAPCRWCKGRKTNRGSTRKRFGNCRRCGGTGHRIRFGARTVHRAILRKEL
jgi:hypothetical protein